MSVARISEATSGVCLSNITPHVAMLMRATCSYLAKSSVRSQNEYRADASTR
jgi:hypothetical protein